MARRSIRYGLTPIGARTIASAVGRYLSALAREWDDALSHDAVTGTFDRAREDAVRSVTGRHMGSTAARRVAEAGGDGDTDTASGRSSRPHPGIRAASPLTLTPDELSDLEAMLATDGVIYLLTILAEQDSAYLAALLEVYRSAAAARLPIPEYVSRLHHVADRFGADRDNLGDLYRTWLAFAVESPLIGRADVATGTTPAGMGAFPYLEQVTAADERVRTNHAALHGFTARTEWTGWELEVLPPLGWGCRCRPRRVSRQEAEDRGLVDLMDEVSEGMLARFRALGGADDDFPRHRFVLPPA